MTKRRRPHPEEAASFAYDTIRNTHPIAGLDVLDARLHSGVHSTSGYWVLTLLEAGWPFRGLPNATTRFPNESPGAVTSSHGPQTHRGFPRRSPPHRRPCPAPRRQRDQCPPDGPASRLSTARPDLHHCAPAAPRAVQPPRADVRPHRAGRSEEHTSELQSRRDLVCRLLLEKKKK